MFQYCDLVSYFHALFIFFADAKPYLQLFMAEVLQLFEWMQKHGKINIASYSSYIKFMGERKDISKALNVYETINDQTMRNNSSICNSVLSSLVKNNKFEKAMSMFEQMKQNGLLPDVVTYSTVCFYNSYYVLDSLLVFNIFKICILGSFSSPLKNVFRKCIVK